MATLIVAGILLSIPLAFLAFHFYDRYFYSYTRGAEQKMNNSFAISKDYMLDVLGQKKNTITHNTYWPNGNKKTVTLHWENGSPCIHYLYKENGDLKGIHRLSGKRHCQYQCSRRR